MSQENVELQRAAPKRERLKLAVQLRRRRLRDPDVDYSLNVRTFPRCPRVLQAAGRAISARVESGAQLRLYAEPGR
jgi:hypothetical protein